MLTSCHKQFLRIPCMIRGSFFNYVFKLLLVLTGQRLITVFSPRNFLMENHVHYNENIVLRTYTKVCVRCGDFYGCMRFAKKAKIISWNSNADNICGSYKLQWILYKKHIYFGKKKESDKQRKSTSINSAMIFKDYHST